MLYKQTNGFATDLRNVQQTAVGYAKLPAEGMAYLNVGAEEKNGL